MTLYLIGLGLSDEKDITLRGLETIKKCDKIYLENYTSALIDIDLKDLEKFYGKKIDFAERDLVEQTDEIVDNAKEKDVALLIIGDPFGATTHLDILMRCKEKGVTLEVIHNASIMTAIGLSGLQLYKFGKTVTVPYPEVNFKPEIYYEVLRQNKILGLHTLLLLDLKPKENRFMTVKEAIELLLEIETRKQFQTFTPDTMCIGVARLGSKNKKIAYGTAKQLMEVDFGEKPHSLIVPGELHFMEEEALDMYKVK